MSAVREAHEKAMDQFEQGLLARMTGKPDDAERLFRIALDLELKAIEQAHKEAVPEPTHSVLRRSAASLAINCSEFRIAEKLIAEALAGEPPVDIADELRDLLENVYFNRHLNLRGIALTPDEIQLSVAGKAVGFGFALSDLFVERIENTSRLIYRTVERRLRRPFRETGTIAKAVREYCQLFISVPRPASLAISLKVGRLTAQSYDPEIVGVTDIIDDVLDGLDLLNEGKTEELRDRIQDDAYYTNFVSLTKLIAPDGDDLSVVGFTSLRYGKERRVALTRPAEKIKIAPPKTYVSAGEEHVAIRGRLLFADALKTKQIRIVDSQGKQHAINVPLGMMADIVKPLWETDTIVKASRLGETLILEDIAEVNPEDVSDYQLFYVNLGDGTHRSWEDNRKYGFISAGFDRKYSSQLERLHLGDRIFAYLKGTGFVGYGIVQSRPMPARDFIPPVAGTPLSELELENKNVLHDLNDLERSEWVVAVDWLKTFDRFEAKTFPGIFTNENIACRLSDAATIEFLRREFNPVV